MPSSHPPTRDADMLAPGPKREAIQIIKYMGSKRGILDFVVPAIQSVTPVGMPVVDLFSGTHSVGYALAGSHPIIANDIQHYSAPLGHALLSEVNALPSKLELWRHLESAFLENSSKLNAAFEPWLSKERSLIKCKTITLSNLRKYAAFQSSFPHVGEMSKGTNPELAKLISSLYGKRNKKDSWYLATLYFNNSYFALWQCIEIDSLRRAIAESLPKDSHVANVALSCLLHACGYSTPGAGHFAQFRQLNSLAMFSDILRYRNRSIRDYFLAKYSEFREHLLPAAYANSILTGNYADLLRSLPNFKNMRNGLTIYADPPYSAVHYSRFYHVLETLTRYDYPESTFFGRYRSDRHQSAFCNGGALNEFKTLIEGSRKLGANLVLSYADSAIVPLQDLANLCIAYYGRRKVATLRSGHEHRTMGRSRDKTRVVEEVAMVCRA